MLRSKMLCLIGAVAMVCGVAVNEATAQDEHWARHFAAPARSKPMTAQTGMTDGTGRPRIWRAKWHDGHLYMSGAWESGMHANDFSSRQRNEYWHLWSWSPEAGWTILCWYHSANGGNGPDGVIMDFEFLPDGRLVVVGSFTRLDNPGGHRYHDVNGLGIYDPKEPTANKWKPLGTVQYNGTVSAGGTIYSVEYDPQGDHLYVGGTFGGIPNKGQENKSPFVHRYDFKTKSWEPMKPGVNGSKPVVYRIFADTSTKPSTIYVGGKFHYTAGNGLNPEVSASTAKYSTGLAKWKEGHGWTPFPMNHPTDGSKGKESGILQRAADFAMFDSARVLDFLVDDHDDDPATAPEIWIVGAFSEGQETEQKLRGIAKWDDEKQMWIDPTGKGGVGRECYSIAKAANGKIYFAGAFGGRKGASEFFDGFKNGDAAALAISYDPKSGEWAQLGSGLSSNVMPECRLAVNGNDVYYVGDFEFIDPKNFGNSAKAEFSSAYIARWNETIDFTKDAPKLADGNTTAGHPFLPGPPTKPQATGNEHWSRRYAPPLRGKPMTANTGMDRGIGTPDVMGLTMIGDTLYFAGNWEAARGERWYVWSYSPKDGWAKLAWEARGGKSTGVDSKPEGCKAINGKLYVFGAIDNWNGIGIFDPSKEGDVAAKWSKLTGKFNGKDVMGNAMEAGAGPINDIAFDEGTGDLYLVGSTGLEHVGAKFPKDVARVIRVDKDGNYHPMGYALKPENPGKPISGIYSIVLDTSKTPTDIYIGGTFNYYGPTPTTNERMLYNVAKWDHEAKDWRPIGKGDTVNLKEIDARWYPGGLPGLAAKPERYTTFIASGFPRIRDIEIDNEGNLYAGGTLGIIDNTLPIADRKETFGLAKYDKATDTWMPATNVGGVSRDIFEMTWLDDAKTKMLITGSFMYDEQWNLLGNVAVYDTRAGTLTPLGGGLRRAGMDLTIGANVVHHVAGDNWFFAGFFDHAGPNGNDAIEAPNPSAYFAFYNAKRNMDPNAGLVIKPNEGFVEPTGFSSKSVKVPLEVELTEGEGTITWYEKSTSGQFRKKATGPKYSASLRVKAGSGDQIIYVTVTRANGVEGGKIPVRIEARKP